MYLIFEYPYDPAVGSVIIDPDSGNILVFDTKDEAVKFARENCNYPYIIFNVE